MAFAVVLLISHFEDLTAMIFFAPLFIAFSSWQTG
jgi:hypothetical protein